MEPWRTAELTVKFRLNCNIVRAIKLCDINKSVISAIIFYWYETKKLWHFFIFYPNIYNFCNVFEEFVDTVNSNVQK